MSYCKEFATHAPPMKDADEAAAFAPYSDNGIASRIQSVLGLSNSDSGWYGYEGSHKKYSEIGTGINWPGKTRRPQVVPVGVLNDLGLQRVDVSTKIGRLIVWNCGIVHGNFGLQRYFATFGKIYKLCARYNGYNS